MCLSIAVDFPNLVLETGEFSGLEYVITHNGRGYRCGYVRIEKDHPLYGQDDPYLEVHGGVTFSEADKPCDKGGKDDAWWLGFDCCHLYDLCDLSLPSDYYIFANPDGSGTIKDTDYVRNQCKSMAKQLKEMA